MNGVTNESAALSTWSYAGYDRFGANVRRAGAGAMMVTAQIVEKTDRLSAFIGDKLSLNILYCIIMNLLK
jgi:hypothetical protein